MSEIKSAFELAMERHGGPSRHLTDRQKQALASIGAQAEAKIAEIQILFDQQIAAESDPAKAAFALQACQEQIAKIKADAEKEKETVRNA